jgi:tRNA(His) guanylyltransferase
MIDGLGDRMKQQYENRTRFLLPRRTYTIIRCDGKAFHTYTRNMLRPFDHRLMYAMDEAMLALCDAAQGAALGYVQSDEISVLLTDFATIHTDAWFDGNVQKIASVAASVVTAAFNARIDGGVVGPRGLACFDARVFTIPDPTEVENYFIWRQKDATRNSLMAFAQSFFSSRDLHGKSQADVHDMLHGIGKNWNDLMPELKRGRGGVRMEGGGSLHYPNWARINDLPIFTQDRSWLATYIPGIPT